MLYVLASSASQFKREFFVHIASWFSAIVGPIAGIVLVDYYILQRTIIDVNGLYYYDRGFILPPFVALGLSIGPLVSGFLEQHGVVQEFGVVFVVIYGNA